MSTSKETNPELIELRALYPEWNIRASKDERSSKATRRDRLGLSDEETHAGLHMTLIEDTPAELAVELSRQAEIEQKL